MVSLTSLHESKSGHPVSDLGCARVLAVGTGEGASLAHLFADGEKRRVFVRCCRGSVVVEGRALKVGDAFLWAPGASVRVDASPFQAIAVLARQATDVEAIGSEMPGVNVPGAGAPGADVSGAEAPGAEAPGAEAPGAEAPGAEAPGAPGASYAPGADEPGPDEAGAVATGADEPGADGAGAVATGARGTQLYARGSREADLLDDVAVAWLSGDDEVLGLRVRELLRRVDGEAGSVRHAARRGVAFRAREAMGSSIAEPLTIPELAEVCSTSPTVLKEAFRDEFGVPVYEWYRRLRMLRASEMLGAGAAAVAGVAAEVGYSNASKFARAFADCMGVSPSVYRAV